MRQIIHDAVVRLIFARQGVACSLVRNIDLRFVVRTARRRFRSWCAELSRYRTIDRVKRRLEAVVRLISFPLLFFLIDAG